MLLLGNVFILHEWLIQVACYNERMQRWFTYIGALQMSENVEMLVVMDDASNFVECPV